MVRVLLGGNVAAGAGQALEVARQIRNDEAEAERREVEFQRNLAIADQQAALALERGELDLAQGRLGLAQEQDPTSYLNQGRRQELEAGQADIEYRQARADYYRQAPAPGTRSASAGSASQAGALAAHIQQDSPLLRFLGKTRGPQALEAYARLSVNDQKC